MSLNKILYTLCAIIVCLTLVLSSPIPGPENTITQLVEVNASPIQTVSVETNTNSLPIRVARHLFRNRNCRWCGSGYGGNGGYSGAQSSAVSSAGSSGFGNTQTNAQSQSASFNFGPISASISSASASSSSGSRRGGFFDY